MKRTFFGMVILFCALIFSAALPGGSVLAHVSADSMPDSVAETEYLIYLEFRPNDLTVRNKLGMVYYRQGKLELAAREFYKILQRNPDNCDALDGMGLVKAAQQDFAAAARYHQHALSVNADDMMVHYHLGCALEKKGKFREAAAAYNSALAVYRKQYPAGTGEKQAVEFLETVKTALDSLDNK
ncbi:MAG: tetratricopeptide repeat protein [Desulfobulbaceae bacterium]|nr:tetratricopeptide repeat protein [Desulfobulbaceae bacterium]